MKLRLIEQDMQHDALNSPKQLVTFIKKQCQPFLQAIAYDTMLHMYRGSAAHPDLPAYVKPIRTDRRLVDTEMKYTVMYNDLVFNKGLKANRNNSIFCTGNLDIAKRYGEVFIVLPIGTFNYTWNQDIGDFYTWVEADADLGVDNIKTALSNTTFLGDDGTLESAIESGHEILIHAQTALYISLDMYAEVEELL